MGVTGGLPAVARGAAEAPPEVRVGYLSCAFAVWAVWAGLRAAGFARTIRVVRSVAACGSRPPVGLDEVQRVAGRVATVAAFFPARALCLEQSLALYCVLRRRGISATLRLGVHPAPFAAHAWVEYGGVPINEDADRIHELLPLPIDVEEIA